MKSVLIGAVLATGLVGAPAWSQDAEVVEYGWSGQGEFGLVHTTGNTETEAYNGKLEFIHNSEQWRHRLLGAVLSSSKDGVQDSERYLFEGQSDYKLSDISYLFGVLRWDSDKFGVYDPQSTLAVGYGRELMQSATHLLKGEIGVGYRKLEERLTGITSSDAILRLLLDDSWKITDNTEWLNRLLVESGSDNTFSQFNTALSVAMNAKLAVKLGYEIRHNTEVPAGTLEKTDTVATVNLVYNFN